MKAMTGAEQLKEYCTKWEALWPEDLVLEFAVSSTWLSKALLEEVDRVDNRAKRTRRVFEGRAKMFEEFASAGDDRDLVAKRIRERLQEAEQLGIRQSCMDIAVPLVRALREGEISNIRMQGSNLLALDDPSGKIQKTIWASLVEYPYAFKVRDIPDLIALRILPNFIGGTNNFREALSEHLSELCTGWSDAISHLEAAKTWLEHVKSTPLRRVEHGTWWIRILLEGIADGGLHSQVILIVLDHLKLECEQSVWKRELTHYFPDQVIKE